MLITAGDILNYEPIKVFEQQLTTSSLVVEEIKKITQVVLNQQDITVENNQQVKINTTGAKKMVLVLHKESIKQKLQQIGLTLKL